MVRNRKRTSNRQSWSEVTMARAIKAVTDQGLSYKKASQKFDIPQTTLERRIKKYRQSSDVVFASEKGLGKYETVFSPIQEKQLVTYVHDMEQRLHGLTMTELRILAWQLAEQNGIAHTFSDGMAGKDWIAGFLKRHPILSIRKPEATSAARAMGFNKIVVDNFYSLLEETLEKYPLTADRIFNVDEMGCSTVAKHMPKIIATKGKRQVGIVTSGERGQNVTVELCVSASGVYLPPMFVFPRKRMNPNFLLGAPEGSWAVCHPSGWMQSELFFKWFKWFVSSVHPTKDDPVLLLLDGHTTHTRNLEVINYARENNVIILCFPPHCTHRLQPLDVSFMRPISIFYAAAVKKWMTLNPGCVVQPAQIPGLFGEAFVAATKPETAINGFRKTGIWPFNRAVFSEEDFMPAAVTDRPPASPPGEQAQRDDDTFIEDMNLPNVPLDHTLDMAQREQSMEDNHRVTQVPRFLAESSQGTFYTAEEGDELCSALRPEFYSVEEEGTNVSNLNDEYYTAEEGDELCSALRPEFSSVKEADTDVSSLNDEFYTPEEGYEPHSNLWPGFVHDKENVQACTSRAKFFTSEESLEAVVQSVHASSHESRSPDFIGDLSQSLSQVSIRNDVEHASEPQVNCSTPSKRPRESSSPEAQCSKMTSARKTRGCVTSYLKKTFSSTDDDSDPPIACAKDLRRSSRLGMPNFKVTPYDIQPLPSAKEDQPRRKRCARGKTAILSDSPYRNELCDQKKKYVKRKPVKSAEEDASCIFCDGLYSESVESWIQCQQCQGWAHNSGAGVEESIQIKYKCDLCK